MNLYSAAPDALVKVIPSPKLLPNSLCSIVGNLVFGERKVIEMRMIIGVMRDKNVIVII